jgi:hypothetical protein
MAKAQFSSGTNLSCWISPPMAKFIALAAALHLIETQAAEYVPEIYSGPYNYDPFSKVDPFDPLSQTVSSWLTAKDKSVPLPFQCNGNPDWETGFCECLENGNIQSWYQKNSMFYVLHTCSAHDGLVMRTGHMQDRHTMPMQAMMACDVLKVFSFCWRVHCPAAIRNWTDHCEEAHYTVPGCDVDCNAATPQAGYGLLSILIATAAGFGLARLA